MLDRFFPAQFDNNYRGQRAGLWLFYALMFMNVGISFVAIFRSDGGAQSADGIPLNTFGVAGAQAVIGVVAYLGLADLLFELVCVLAMFRYRSMVPLLYVLLVTQWLGHKGIGWMKPIPRVAAASGSFVNLGLFVLTLLGLMLSVTGRGYLAAQKRSVKAPA